MDNDMNVTVLILAEGLGKRIRSVESEKPKVMIEINNKPFVHYIIDELIKGGINIVPAEIEEVLYMHKDVHEAAVIGINHDVLGEEIIASIALKDDSLDKSDVKTALYALLSKNLSSYKHPIDILFFASLPKTHSGKLKRREVRRIIEDEYDR